MKILILVSNARIGGVEKLISRLLKHFDRARFGIDLIVTHTGGVLLEEYAKYSNLLCLEHIGTNPGERLGRCKVDAIKSIIEAEKYDVIHLFNLYELQEIILELGDRFNFIQSIHLDLTIEDSRVFWRDRVLSSREKLKAVVVDSRKNLSVIDDALYIPNGVDTSLFKPCAKEKKTIAWVGRLTAEKGIDRLINIARGLPGYRFTVAGNEKRFLYPDLIKASSTIPNIEVKTGLSDKEIAAILARSKYFLFTSRHEGMPLALLEAMASGCCCITTGVGAVPDIIQDGSNGYVVPNEDGVENVIINGFSRFDNGVGERARETILRGYSIENMAAKLTDIYDRISGTMPTKARFPDFKL